MNSYKTLCRTKCRIDRRIKKYKKPKIQQKQSPDWFLVPRIKRRIQRKKDMSEDFKIDDKYNDKLNEKIQI